MKERNDNDDFDSAEKNLIFVHFVKKEDAIYGITKYKNMKNVAKI